MFKNYCIWIWTLKIERIGNLIEAQPNVLYSMTKAKLLGEAANWFTTNQVTLTEWEELNAQMLTHESIITYYDSIIKLCREYDPSMSDKVKISFLEKGLKDELKIQVKRQMRALTEQIPHAFLQIAKAEAELLSEVQLPSEHSRILFHPRYQQLHDLLTSHSAVTEIGNNDHAGDDSGI
ncbi:unnamed protein product, partial [Didymodactylos carnosus]